MEGPTSLRRNDLTLLRVSRIVERLKKNKKEMKFSILLWGTVHIKNDHT